MLPTCRRALYTVRVRRESAWTNDRWVVATSCMHPLGQAKQPPPPPACTWTWLCPRSAKGLNPTPVAMMMPIAELAIATSRMG